MKSIADALGLEDSDFGEDDYNNDISGNELDIKTDESIDLNEVQKSLDQIKQFKIKLSEIPDLSNRKQQLSKLADLAELKFQQVLNIALNSDPRFAAGMIQAAATILKAALDAHTRILAVDVKLIDMQIKKDKMEFDMNSKVFNVVNSPEKEVEDSSISSSDRNAVLAKLKGKNTK